MPRSTFHRLVQFVRDGFPTDDDNVAHGVQVVPLVMEFLSPGTPWYSVFLLSTGEEPTDDGRQEQNHAHHDVIGFHGSGAENVVLCLRTIRCDGFAIQHPRSGNL